MENQTHVSQDRPREAEATSLPVQKPVDSAPAAQKSVPSQDQTAQDSSAVSNNGTSSNHTVDATPKSEAPNAPESTHSSEHKPRVGEKRDAPERTEDLAVSSKTQKVEQDASPMESAKPAMIQVPEKADSSEKPSSNVHAEKSAAAPVQSTEKATPAAPVKETEHRPSPPPSSTPAPPVVQQSPPSVSPSAPRAVEEKSADKNDTARAVAPEVKPAANTPTEEEQRIRAAPVPAESKPERPVEKVEKKEESAPKVVPTKSHDEKEEEDRMDTREDTKPAAVAAAAPTASAEPSSSGLAVPEREMSDAPASSPSPVKEKQSQKLPTETPQQKHPERDSSVSSSPAKVEKKSTPAASPAEPAASSETKAASSPAAPAAKETPSQQEAKPKTTKESAKEKKKEEDPVPIMSGTYRIEQGFGVWDGSWAFQEEFVGVPGKSSKFSFKSRTSVGAVALKGPVNGTYDGYFNFKAENAPTRKFEEKGLNLTFTQNPAAPNSFKVKGYGKNKFGDFELDGSYSGSTGELRVEKRYIS